MSNLLKRQGKSGVAQVIENHLPADRRPILSGPRRPAATPRGGAARQEGLPLAQRPVCLSGHPRAEK